MTDSLLKSHVHKDSQQLQTNSRRMIDLLTEIKNEEEQIRRGGGPKAIEAQHKKGRLTARERIAKLIDPATPFFELGIYAAARLWVDAIIDPAQTREALIWALEAAALNPEVRQCKTGVLQT